MDTQTYIILNETNLKVAEAERQAEFARVLAESRAARPSLRVRTATLLVALARRLSPEAVSAEEKQSYLHA